MHLPHNHRKDHQSHLKILKGKWPAAPQEFCSYDKEEDDDDDDNDDDNDDGNGDGDGGGGGQPQRQQQQQPQLRLISQASDRVRTMAVICAPLRCGLCSGVLPTDQIPLTLTRACSPATKR